MDKPIKTNNAIQQTDVTKIKKPILADSVVSTEPDVNLFLKNSEEVEPHISSESRKNEKKQLPQNNSLKTQNEETSTSAKCKI